MALPVVNAPAEVWCWLPYVTERLDDEQAVVAVAVVEVGENTVVDQRNIVVNVGRDAGCRRYVLYPVIVDIFKAPTGGQVVLQILAKRNDFGGGWVHQRETVSQGGAGIVHARNCALRLSIESVVTLIKKLVEPDMAG